MVDRRHNVAGRRARCARLANLDFQVACDCGFDGARAPAEDALSAVTDLADRITRDLRVGANGSVKATVEAQSIIVSGELIGDCTAASRVEIQSTGRLTGTYTRGS